MENSYEYIIKQRAEGKALFKKIALFISYFAFAAILALFTFGFAPEELYTPIFMIIAALTAFFAFITWRFVCVEYEIVISGGDVKITTIYGKGFSRPLLCRPVASFSEIGEYDDKAFEEISKISLQRNYLCISSLSASCVYYALFEDEKDQCILYFDAPERAIKKEQLRRFSCI